MNDRERRWCLIALAAAGLVAQALVAGSAMAQGTPAAGAEADIQTPRPEDKEEARRRYERGLDLFKRELWGPALAELSEARRLYPTWSSTLLAARCLKALGRFDEALDTYAVLVRDFEDRLKDDKRGGERLKAVLQEINDLRRLVGSVEIEGAEPGASIVINGQARGFYPLLEPLRVPSGSHIVRVFKQGFEPVERRIEVAGGTRRVIEARLPKLQATGTLRVVEALGRELEVIVDGFPVGRTPLTLPFAPGKHAVLLRGEGDLGTAPAMVTVRADELAELRVEAEVLNATLRVVPTPFDALVSIDSVLIGRGVWDGRVRPGGHSIEVAAEGFLPEKRRVILLNKKRGVLEVELERDPQSPFWRVPPPPPHFLVDMSTGPWISGSFGGDVTSSCAEGCQGSAGLGAFGVIRGGYEWSSRVSFGLAAGFLTASQSTRGRAAQLNVVKLPEQTAAFGQVDDVITIGGALAAAWVGYSFDVVRFPVGLRLSAGGLWGNATDARSGSFRAQLGAPGAAYPVGTAVERRGAAFGLVMPEVRAGLPLQKGVEVYAGLSALVLFSASPPRWSEDHAINAGADGYGWFSDTAFVSGVSVGFVPAVGAKFEL